MVEDLSARNGTPYENQKTATGNNVLWKKNVKTVH